MGAGRAPVRGASPVTSTARLGTLNGPARRAGPWSGMKMSVTLSIRVVTTSESTGSKTISTVGSKSCNTAANWLAGLSSVHTTPS
jgi:hypothetical protein